MLTLTKGQVQTLTASLEAMLLILKASTKPSTKAVVKQPKAVAKPKASVSKSNVSTLQDRILKRNIRVYNGFRRRGIKLAFDKANGRFVNVKPYQTWLAEGRQVMRGQSSVEGFFHISQTQAA